MVRSGDWPARPDDSLIEIEQLDAHEVRLFCLPIHFPEQLLIFLRVFAVCWIGLLTMLGLMLVAFIVLMSMQQVRGEQVLVVGQFGVMAGVLVMLLLVGAIFILIGVRLFQIAFRDLPVAGWELRLGPHEWISIRYTLARRFERRLTPDRIRKVKIDGRGRVVAVTDDQGVVVLSSFPWSTDGKWLVQVLSAELGQEPLFL